MSLIEALDRESWLALDSNRAQWQRLASACALADGFALFAVQVEDAIAAGHVAALLAELPGVPPLVRIALQPDTSVTTLLEHMRAAARPCLFWLAGEHTGPEFASFFALLNQKREVVSTLADGPLVLALHPLAWTHFRHAAPDFWSIHQAVFRFGAARRVAVEPVRRVRSASPGPTQRSLPRARWRLDDASLASGPTPLGEHETELRRLVAALHEPGATILVTGPAGSGKTTLVAAALPAIAKRYPGGVFRVPLGALSGGVEDEARTILTTLLEHELRQRVVQVRRLSEVPLHALRSQFVHATLGRAALLWLEDVETPELLAWLVPGPGTSLVVTSRDALALPDRAFDHVIRLATAPSEARASAARSLAPVELPTLEHGLDSLSDVLAHDDERDEPLALQQRGERALERGDLASAKQWFERTLALDEALGEAPYALILLARLDRVRGDVEAAVTKLALAYPQFRTLDTAAIDEELSACHEAASPEVDARIRATWEAAGHEWPFADEDSYAD